MDSSEYAGMVWDFEISEAKDGTGFEKIGFIFDFSPDNNKTEVTRDYMTGEHFRSVSSFTNGATFRTTKTVVSNLKAALSGYILDEEEDIEGLPGAKAAAGGVLSLGKKVKTQPLHYVRLTPKNASQSEGTLHYIDATIEFDDYTNDDNLLELTIRLDAAHAYKGNIVFGE